MKKKMIVLFLVSTLLFELVTPQLNAQTTYEPYWLLLEKGKQYYRFKEYGKALIAFEDAKRIKDELYLKMQRDFIEFLSANEVRALGDSLNKILLYLNDKPNKRISEIIEEINFNFSETLIQDSAKNLISLFDILRLYPEAEYWIGEVYREEGEINIALQQYNRALSQQLLINPNELTTQIRYKIADMFYILGNYPQYEKTLIEIVSEDSLWNGDDRSQSFIRSSMFKTLTEDGVNRFLTLYRYDSIKFERAHRLLGLYYYATGRYDKSVEHLTYAFLIQNTILIKEYQLKEYTYVFKDFTQLITSSARLEDLENYMYEVDFFKTNYYLAAAMYATGQRSIAFYLWNIIAKTNKAAEWQKRSKLQIEKPYIEPVNERP